MADLIYAIQVVFKNNEIESIIGPNSVVGDPVTPGDIKKYKNSPHGLRFVDAISYTVDANAAPVAGDTTLVTKCYTIIGGFKVQVPCG